MLCESIDLLFHRISPAIEGHSNPRA